MNIDADDIREQWKSIHKQMVAIVEREKALDPVDRNISKILPLCESYARNKEWKCLLNCLNERGLLAREQPKPTQKRKQKREPFVARCVVKKQIKNLLTQVLFEDKAIGIPTVETKLLELGCTANSRLCRDYLSEFAKEGLIYKSNRSYGKAAFYSLQITDVIDKDEWLPAAIAFGIALERGYPHGIRSFISHTLRIKDPNRLSALYAKFGIQYRFEHKNQEVLKWKCLD